MKNFLISTLFHKTIATGKAGLCLLALGTGASMYGTTALYKLATAPPASAPAAASAKIALTQYSAGTREGLIGVTEAVPVDNPADNVFHVQVKEVPGRTDKVYLVYELSGVADHTAVSRGVNDQLSVGRVPRPETKRLGQAAGVGKLGLVAEGRQRGAFYPAGRGGPQLPRA